MFRSFRTCTMRHRQGFTLIELSIAIIVIAFIAGSIVIGKRVIRNSEIQTIVADVNRYKNAAKLFKDKYRYLPGDLPNATSLWGADASCPNTASNGIRKRTTCNGNGDGFVGGHDGAGFPSPVSIGGNYREAVRAWQHLANAQLIKGTYTGAGYGSGTWEPTFNMPESPAGNGFIMFYSAGVNADNELPDGTVVSSVYPGKYGHIIEYGATANGVAVTNPLTGAALKPAEALQVDQKIDDGLPGMGNVRALTPDGAADCASSALAVSAEYLTSENNSRCPLIFITGL